MDVTDKMIQVLDYLNSDSWFRPSSSDNKITLTDKNGNEHIYPKSYYAIIEDVGPLRIRVSDHGTYLNTWLYGDDDPNESLQNISIVLSDEIPTYSTEIQPTNRRNSNNENVLVYLYFVVEQYRYPITKLSFKDFKKIINRLKRLEKSDDVFGVYIDPFRNKPAKKADRKIITPTDRDGNKIPIPNDLSKIHPRQISVVNNPNFEIDKDGNIIEKVNREFDKIYHLTETQLLQIVKNVVNKVLNENM